MSHENGLYNLGSNMLILHKTLVNSIDRSVAVILLRIWGLGKGEFPPVPPVDRPGHYEYH